MCPQLSYRMSQFLLSIVIPVVIKAIEASDNATNANA